MAIYQIKCTGSPKQPGIVSKVTVTLPDGISIRELLDFLLDNTDLLGERNRYGEIRPDQVFRILVNGRNIRVLDGSQTILTDGAQIAILLPIAGG